MLRVVFGMAAVLILVGCSVHPLPDQVTRQSTLGIVTAIHCEAQQAILEHAPEPAFNKGAIGYIFDFDIIEHNQAGLDVAFSQPFISGGAFDLTLTGAKADLLRRAERRFTIVDTFEELKRADCSEELRRSRFKYPIAGSIGLNEVIATFIGIDQLGVRRLGLEDFKPAEIGGHAATFSDELTYTTAIDTGTLNPKLTLNPVPGVFRLTELSITKKADRVDKHRLLLALALPDPPRSSPTHAVRMAARRTAARGMGVVAGGPMGGPIVGSTAFVQGLPSKIQIQGEVSPQARVLMELDRRVLLSKAIVIAP
jgi:hypothetical protein